MTRQDDDERTVCDSRCWFPPLELAALVAAGVSGDFREAASRAEEAIDSGAARETLRRLADFR